MARKKYTLIDSEALKEMPKDRRDEVISFRLLMVKALQEIVMLLHTMQCIKPGEKFDLQLVTDCGFNGVMTIAMNNLGVCEDPLQEEHKQQLMDMASRLYMTSKGTAFHGMAEVDDINDVPTRAKKLIEERKKAREEAGKDKHEGLTEVERLIDEVVKKRKEERKQAPPSTKPFGFLD